MSVGKIIVRIKERMGLLKMHIEFIGQESEHNNTFPEERGQYAIIIQILLFQR